MDVQKYLDRINYSGPLDPSITTLRGLHRAHMFSVPFENLDIHIGRPILLGEEVFFNKIVERRRGGFCYELNGIFAALLRQIGFDVTLLSAGVARPGGGFSPDFDHMALLVRVPIDRAAGDRSATDPAPLVRAPNDRAPRARSASAGPDGEGADSDQAQSDWLADVGFGDSFIDPISLDESTITTDATGAYRVAPESQSIAMLPRTAGSDVESTPTQPDIAESGVESTPMRPHTIERGLAATLTQPHTARSGDDASRIHPNGPESALESMIMQRRAADSDGVWEHQYRFSLQPRRLSEYEDMCRYQQTSPDSHFTQNRICSLATPAGRITVTNDKLITTTAGIREERTISGQSEFNSLLADLFGIHL